MRKIVREKGEASIHLIANLVSIAQLIRNVYALDPNELLRDSPLVEVTRPIARVVCEIDATANSGFRKSG